ncbi:MAG TPA: peptidoglycan-binding domain-containing protein [Nostocaceae cyanobacterium]|nr:peptidoglycan-binding domain-containing protein [Nostocaceae cyanobacterium]
MKGSLTNSISHYYRLLLLTATPALIAFSGMVAIAAPVKIAQVAATVNINRPTLKIGSQGERVSELQAALKLLGFYTGAVDGIYSENTASAVSQFKQAAGLTPDGVVDSITWQKLFPTPPTATTTTTPSTTPTTATKPRPSTGVTVPAKPNNTTTRTNTTQQRPQPKPAPTPRSQNTNRTQPATNLIQPTPKNKQIPTIQYTAEGWPILRVGMRGSDVLKLQQILQRLGFLKAGVDGDFGVTTEAAVKAAQTRYGLEADGVVGGATWEAFVRQYSQQR